MAAQPRKTRLALTGALALVVTAGVAVSAATPAKYERPGKTDYITQQNRECGGHADISANGRYVVYTQGKASVLCEIYRFDRVTGATEIVSVGVSGTKALAPPTENVPVNVFSISADGRYVAFDSSAVNLVPSDTNAVWDVFLRDMKTKTTRRISVATGGTQAQAPLPVPGAGSTYPSISTDGRYVAYYSNATNLVPNDTNGVGDIFRYDIRTGRTIRVSVGAGGSQADQISVWPSISGNGRFVQFDSWADNLVPADTATSLSGTSTRLVYVRDVDRGQTTLVSVASDGSRPSFAGLPGCAVTPGSLVTVPDPLSSLTHVVPSNQFCTTSGSYQHAISDDGRYVVFSSNATNLVPNPPPAHLDSSGAGVDTGAETYVHDLKTGRTERVSVDSYGQNLPRLQVTGAGEISGDGSYVIFRYFREAMLPVGGQGAAQLVMGHSRLDGSAQNISAAATGSEATTARGCSFSVAGIALTSEVPTSTPDGISRDGRYISFNSNTQDLVAGRRVDNCGYYVRDRGLALGVRAFTGNPPGPVAPPQPICVVPPLCVPPTVSTDLLSASVVARSPLQDLALRWDLRRLNVASPAGEGTLYGVNFNVDGRHFQVRVQRTLGPDFDAAGGACFGLFQQTTAGIYTKVATLKGGYGTIGDSVVTAVPLSLLGGKAQLTDVTAYTAVGNYVSGPTKVLDSIRLSR